jgi:hypothetical protein
MVAFRFMILAYTLARRIAEFLSARFAHGVAIAVPVKADTLRTRARSRGD